MVDLAELVLSPVTPGAAAARELAQEAAAATPSCDERDGDGVNDDDFSNWYRAMDDGTAVRRAAFPGTPYPPNTVEVDALFNDLDAKLVATLPTRSRPRRSRPLRRRRSRSGASTPSYVLLSSAVRQRYDEAITKLPRSRSSTAAAAAAVPAAARAAAAAAAERVVGAGVGKTPLLRELRLSTSPSTVEIVVEEEPPRRRRWRRRRKPSTTTCSVGAPSRARRRRRRAR